MIKVAVVDDNKSVRADFASTLTDDPELEVVVTCSGPDARAAVAASRPDVVLLDLGLPEVDGLTVLASLSMRAAGHRPKVLVLAGPATENTIAQALGLGVSGVLVKDVAAGDLIRSVHQVAAGNAVFSEPATSAIRRSLSKTCAPQYQQQADAARIAALSGREIDVLRRLGVGRTNAQIAAELRLAPSTVKDHVSSILLKTTSENRTQAAVLAARMCLPGERE